MSAGDAGLGIGTANIHYIWRGKNGAKHAVQGRPDNVPDTPSARAMRSVQRSSIATKAKRAQ